MTKYRSKDGDPRGLGSMPPGTKLTGKLIGTTGVGDNPPEPAWEIESLTCPDDGTLLRDVDGAIACPECGYSIPVPRVEMPPAFDGPAFTGF